MASVRPIPTSYYYSGQGRLGLGDRDTTTGELKNLIFVGNVTSLSIDIATTKLDHKESMSGQKATDLTVIKDKSATFKFTSESLSLDALRTGLYGSTAKVTGATVTAEAHHASPGKAFPLKHPMVSAVTVHSGATPLVEGTDYQIDDGFGTIYILATSTVVTTPDTAVTVDYTYVTHDRLDTFTQTGVPERYLRFEGLNTVNGDLRIIEIPRASFDPLKGLEMINPELGSGQFEGALLPDTTILDGTSQYMREFRVYANGSTISTENRGCNF